MASQSTETETAAIVRERDREHWLTIGLAPQGARAALVALYAYHTEIAKTRDAVTDPIMGQIRLQWWRETLEGTAAGNPREHPVAEALAEALAAGRLTVAALSGLADAREVELDGEGFETQDAFIAYLDATAGAVHRCALLVLGCTNEAALKASDHVSRAYGITGQLRACAVNAARGHILLPKDLLASHGVTVEALQAGRPEAGLRDVARALADRARDELAAARRLRKKAGRSALPVLVLGRFADAHLKKLRAADYDLFSGRLESVPVRAPLDVLRTMMTSRY